MMQYVELENVPEEANHLLNLLWDRDRKMSLEELAEGLVSEYSMSLTQEEVKDQMELLVDMDYAEHKDEGEDIYYVALGWQEEY
ncbi:MAG: hypothetical protein J6K53_11705 [Roseburia sp.]|nr:hypothetical protein [Roseburia sp.]